MTRALVLFSHPVEESFSAARHREVVDTLSGRGWDVDDCDLYAEGFSPVLTAEERRTYHDTTVNTRPVQDYVDRVRAADALVLVFPVWNYGYPAILKGFFDRVFLPGVSFYLADGQMSRALDNIRKLAAVTTYGGHRFKAMLAGDPPRRIVTRMLRNTTRPDKMRYLALYDMNNADTRAREAFAARVRREMETF